MENRVLAAALVALAALIWGADSLVRFPALAGIPGTALTFYEHLLGLLFLLPFIVRPSRRELGQIRPRHLLPLFLVGIAGETLAGICFGLSYGKVGGGSAAFLQMMQPFFVLAMVSALRRERAGTSYLSWAMSVFIGALVIWVFDSSFDVATLEDSGFWKGASLGVAAVLLWAASNVSGKYLLETFSASSLVFMRWSLSLVGLVIALWLTGTPLEPRLFLGGTQLVSLVAHTLLFALLPLWMFYRGLRVIPASLATFLELACPLTLVFLPWVLGTRKLHEAQWLGGVSVVLGVALLVRLELEFVKPKR